MSLYERFRTIFLANANTVADHLEDPAPHHLKRHLTFLPYLLSQLFWFIM